jgi:hypothetical protein
MNAEIIQVQSQLTQLVHRQRLHLASQPARYVADLKHECEALRHDASTVLRIAAGINQAACELVEEQRKGKA